MMAIALHTPSACLGKFFVLVYGDLVQEVAKASAVTADTEEEPVQGHTPADVDNSPEGSERSWPRVQRDHHHGRHEQLNSEG
eukprot:2986852-Rhodomonas_salina.1